jgi:hypothetical protein
LRPLLLLCFNLSFVPTLPSTPSGLTA